MADDNQNQQNLPTDQPDQTPNQEEVLTPSADTSSQAQEPESPEEPVQTGSTEESGEEEINAAENEPEASEDISKVQEGEQGPQSDESEESETSPTDTTPGARWYVIHTYSGHENRVAETLKQRVDSEHLTGKILEVLVPTQDKIEIRSGKKETVKEKIFPGYILVKMLLDDDSWLAVRTTQGVTSFVGMGNKPTPIPEFEVKTIVNFMQQGQQPTYKQIFDLGDTVKIVDGPFAEFIGKVDTVDKERGKVRVLVSIFGRETPVELDFLQVTKL